MMCLLLTLLLSWGILVPHAATAGQVWIPDIVRQADCTNFTRQNAICVDQTGGGGVDKQWVFNGVSVVEMGSDAAPAIPTLSQVFGAGATITTATPAAPLSIGDGAHGSQEFFTDPASGPVMRCKDGAGTLVTCSQKMRAGSDYILYDAAGTARWTWNSATGNLTAAAGVTTNIGMQLFYFTGADTATTPEFMFASASNTAANTTADNMNGNKYLFTTNLTGLATEITCGFGTAPAAGVTWTSTFRINGNDTALTTSCVSTGISCTNNHTGTGSVAIVGDDRISMKHADSSATSTGGTGQCVVKVLLRSTN